MYYKSLYYVLLMVIFGVLSYLFLNSGFNTETKIVVNYEDNSDVYFTVNYYNSEYDDLYNDKYVSSMVDDIDINFNYNNLFSEYVNGYYKYNVVGYLTAYEDDITNSLWKREYQLLDEKTFVIDGNKDNSIKILDSFNFEFKTYRNEIQQFINDSDIDVLGYNIFDRITKEGRKFGMLLGLITQRPMELSETSLSQCNNFFLFKMLHPKDIEFVCSIVPNISDENLKKMQTLQPGRGMVFGSAFKLPTLIKFDMPNPEPSSSSCNIEKEWFLDK